MFMLPWLPINHIYLVYSGKEGSKHLFILKGNLKLRIYDLEEQNLDVLAINEKALFL